MIPYEEGILEYGSIDRLYPVREVGCRIHEVSIQEGYHRTSREILISEGSPDGGISSYDVGITIWAILLHEECVTRICLYGIVLELDRERCVDIGDPDTSLTQADSITTRTTRYI